MLCVPKPSLSPSNLCGRRSFWSGDGSFQEGPSCQLLLLVLHCDHKPKRDASSPYWVSTVLAPEPVCHLSHVSSVKLNQLPSQSQQQAQTCFLESFCVESLGPH